MHAALPGGVRKTVPDSILLALVQTSWSENGRASLDSSALANFLEAIGDFDRPAEIYERLRVFLDSAEASDLKPAQRTALQAILRAGRPVSIGDLADSGVFRRSVPGAEAIKSFRTRVNAVLIEAGLSLTHNATEHTLDVADMEEIS